MPVRNHNIADGPLLIVEVEIADRSNICVDRSDRVAVEILGPAQPHSFFLSARILVTYSN